MGRMHAMGGSAVGAQVWRGKIQEATHSLKVKHQKKALSLCRSAPAGAPSLARSLDRAACSTLFCAPPSRSVPRTRSDPRPVAHRHEVARAQVAEIKRRLSQKLPCAIPSRPPVAVWRNARLPARTNALRSCPLLRLCAPVVDAPPAPAVCRCCTAESAPHRTAMQSSARGEALLRALRRLGMTQ
jgi:hypothetical protein